MSDKSKILLIEDTVSLARLYEQYLVKENVEVISVETGKEALAELAKNTPAVVMLDINLPDMNGLDILHFIKQKKIPSSVVIITAHDSISTAVEAVRGGAYDFIVKPFNANCLITTIRNALEHQELSQIVETIKAGARKEYHDFIGSSLAMQAVYRIIDAAATSKATVFITGESGTGKELCAEAIHRQSPRAKQPFIAINCSAIPLHLMESEIFGHVKGAYTNAISDRDGAATLADGGTLFLDEIGGMPLELQTKLLRFIQSGSFQKLGGTKIEKVDIRYVCATNKDIQAAVENGDFREDLYYRLHVIPITMPSLSKRGNDVLEIAKKLIKKYSFEEKKAFHSFSRDVEAIFKNYDWPGNVRELQNILRNIVVLNSGDIVRVGMLPAPLDNMMVATTTSLDRLNILPVLSLPPTKGDANVPKTIKKLWHVERDAISEAINFCDGNIQRAAKILGVAPSTIYRKRASWPKEE